CLGTRLLLGGTVRCGQSALQSARRPSPTRLPRTDEGGAVLEATSVFSAAYGVADSPPSLSTSSRAGQTPATCMVASRSGARALRPKRSSQPKRRCARAARGGRGSGGRRRGSAVIVTAWHCQWVLQVRRSLRPGTSFHVIAACRVGGLVVTT